MSKSKLPSHSRLVEGVSLVLKASKGPAEWENYRDRAFTMLRRGCLDISKEIHSLDNSCFDFESIEATWLFLLEISKNRLRIRHCKEVIDVICQSERWLQVTLESERFGFKLSEVSQDVLNFLSERGVQIGDNDDEEEVMSSSASSSEKALSNLSRQGTEETNTRDDSNHSTIEENLNQLDKQESVKKIKKKTNGFFQQMSKQYKVHKQKQQRNTDSPPLNISPGSTHLGSRRNMRKMSLLSVNSNPQVTDIPSQPNSGLPAYYDTEHTIAKLRKLARQSSLKEDKEDEDKDEEQNTSIETPKDPSYYGNPFRNDFPDRVKPRVGFTVGDDNDWWNNNSNTRNGQFIYNINESHYTPNNNESLSQSNQEEQKIQENNDEENINNDDFEIVYESPEANSSLNEGPQQDLFAAYSRLVLGHE